MGTKIDHDKLYKIQTYSFHDAIITVTESCYGRTEIDKPTKPNKHGYMPSPTVHADGSEHYYKYDHWEDTIAVVPLHFDYEDNLTEACYGRTEIDKPAKPNKHGYMQSPTVHTDGTEHYYKYDHWEETIAVVPLHFD